MVVLVLLLCHLASADSSSDFESLRRAMDVQMAWEATPGLSIGERMHLVSTPLLGAEYILDPAGEAHPPDIDPIFRYDAFDCLTFVEEVYSIAASKDISEIPIYRKQLRYGNAPVSFESRHHFMVAQWIPSVIEQGFFIDITAEHGPTFQVVKDYDNVNWAQWRKRSSFVDLPFYPTGKYHAQVLSIEGVIQSIDSIPEGTLIVVVRQDKSHHPVLVTHLGFLVFKDEKPYIRHATKMGDKNVRDDHLPWYFTHLRWFDNWPILGVMLLEPSEALLYDMTVQ
jgi:hypothetical protein